MTTLHALSVPSSQGENQLKYWIHVVLNGEVDVEMSASMWTSLSSVSKSIWQIASNYLNENFWFIFQMERALSKFKCYKPKRITVDFTSLMRYSTRRQQLANFLFKFSYKSLPNHITHIKFSDYFNEPLTKNSLPQSLICVVFGSRFNQKVDNLLPANIKILQFGEDFNNNVDHLPPNLTKLSLDRAYFTKSVDHLPPKLTHLTWYQTYNRPIDHLPPSLTHLQLGYYFSNSVDHLPPNLLSLELGHSFNHSIEQLPESITFLLLGYAYNQPIPKHILPNLTHLILGPNFAFPTPSLPINITHLAFWGNFNNTITYLPPNLIHLTIPFEYDKPIPYHTNSAMKIQMKTLTWLDSMNLTG